MLPPCPRRPRRAPPGFSDLVKALPWYTAVWTKLADPAFDGWFLKFSGANNYHVPACDSNYDPPLCSHHYHDNDQTPGHPRGDGDCAAPCDCGGVPCGEYLWDHRNASLRTYILNEVVLGLNGLQNENVSGVYFDDGWTDSPAQVLPWEPKEGFCDHSPIGGPTEENFYCTADMGLEQADTTAITAAYRETWGLVQQAVIGAGAFAWQYLRQTTAPVGANESTCTAWVRDWRDAASGAYMQEWSNPTKRPLPSVESDLAAFLLVRGPYAWIGYGACAAQARAKRRRRKKKNWGPLGRTSSLSPPPPTYPQHTHTQRTHNSSHTNQHLQAGWAAL